MPLEFFYNAKFGNVGSLNSPLLFFIFQDEQITVQTLFLFRFPSSNGMTKHVFGNAVIKVSNDGIFWIVT